MDHSRQIDCQATYEKDEADIRSRHALSSNKRPRDDPQAWISP